MEGKITKGFTLVEMVIVLAIMSIMFALGNTAFLKYRSQAMVDSVADEIVNTIREAQNNSLSVKSSQTAGCNSKAWSVDVNPSAESIALKTVNDCSGTKQINTEGLVKTYTGQDIDLVTYKNTGTPTNISSGAKISFTSPFAKPFVTSDYCIPAVGSCQWGASVKPTGEWEMSGHSSYNYFSSVSNTLEIWVVKGTTSRKVIVNASGDAKTE